MFQRAKLGIGYLAQEASVFRKLTVEENILAPLEMRDMPKKDRKEKVETLLEEFSLTHVRKNLGMVLSGGERRRTEIARALAVDPSFVLLDEPFAGVDPIAVEEIQGIVARLKKEKHWYSYYRSQRRRNAFDYRSRLPDGGRKTFKAGTAQELADDPWCAKCILAKTFSCADRRLPVNRFW